MIIGISGKIGCGKTVLGKLIARRHNFRRESFGDLLKAECSMVYKYPLSWNYTQEGKAQLIYGDITLPEMPMTVRQILQWHGTEVRRKQDPDYWVDQMRVDLKTLQRSYPEGEILNVVIDDVRFENEARMVKEMGGVLIRIQPYKDWQPGPHAEHESETALDDQKGWDMVLSPKFGALEGCLPYIDSILMKLGVLPNPPARYMGDT